MSSIESRRYYRYKYLTSEHWETLRAQKLAEVDARCKICDKRDIFNDVHHVFYRNLYGATTDDLVVLCRQCHHEVHKAMIRDRKIADEKTVSKRWAKTLLGMRSYCRTMRDKERSALMWQKRLLYNDLIHRLVVYGYIFNVRYCLNRNDDFLVRIRNKLTDNLPEFWDLVCRQGRVKVEWPCGEH